MSENNEKRKGFTVKSPYAVYAEDNDLCSEEMENKAAELGEKPDMKQVFRSALSAAALVAVFVAIALLFAGVSSCINGMR